MYDIFLGKIDIPLDNLFHVSTGLGLSQFIFNQLIEICIAQLGNDVGVVLGRVDLMHIEYVLLVFELFKDGNFALEQDTVDFVFEHFHVDDFDGYFLVGFVLAASIDLAGVTFAYDICQAIGVVLYFFASEA